MAKHSPWSRQQLLVVFRLYCRTPFGRLNRSNSDIQELAAQLNRTPSAVIMKAVNFASFDPTHQARGVSGLANASRADGDLWEEFVATPTRVAAEAEAAYESLQNPVDLHLEETYELPIGPTEVERTVLTRRVQSFFRWAVLAAYGNRCAISGLSVPTLLNASHIIPWNADESRRADPCNGLSLNTLYDRAFDRGLITLDEDHRVIVSPQLNAIDPGEFHRRNLIEVHGNSIRLPDRFAPSEAALEYHREKVFMAA